MSTSLTDLLAEARQCVVCAEHLPHGPRPVMAASSTAGIVIIGQAPGRKVHETGVPWDDPSGTRLRTWLGLTSEEFYDDGVVAIVPMGFCYPGTGTSGDLPPRPECAPLWHDQILSRLPANRLEVILGTYAQARYVADRKPTLTETVADWQSHLPNRIVLPHPSPRNNQWLVRNPWFETETLPAVRVRVAEAISQRAGEKTNPSAKRTVEVDGFVRRLRTR